MPCYVNMLSFICVEFDPGSYVVNYGFIYVVDKYARDFYMENVNF